MKIRLNGEEAQISDGCSVEQLLAARAVLPPRVAVQRNGVVVRRATYGETRLEEGDEIEIVSFFGGG
jgi:thiamine biosynthesis protein ThiS